MNYSNASTEPLDFIELTECQGSSLIAKRFQRVFNEIYKLRVLQAPTVGGLISVYYKEQLVQMFDKGMWSGGGHVYADEVIKLANKVGASSILDYGCGPGTLRSEIENTLAIHCKPQIEVREYDPGVVGKDTMPLPADVVVCTDVLEHVEPQLLDNVLHHIYGLTNKAALLVISTRPAEKRLPDGRNAHLIVDNTRWWFDQLAKFNWVVSHRRDSDPDNAKFWLRKWDTETNS